MSIKTRFAPSPTGEIHFGNVRTALFSALAAISQQGKFLLRLEDTDEERSSKEYEELVYKDLKWLGIEWQEGSDSQGAERGPDGPYRQSLRKPIYDKYYEQLVANNQAYHCFCSEAQLALSRKLQRAQGLPPRYSGACANLSKEEVVTKIKAGEQPTLRFRVDRESEITFQDLVKGQQTFYGADIGDFIIRRASGTASFMFCNAVDDSLMGVNLALRGEDHLTNTPRQLMILQALGLTAPKYGHISLIVGSDGSPLSKRHGSRSLNNLRKEGYMPQAIVNYLARLGHNYESNDFSDIQQLGKTFVFENLSSSPARYDEQQLYHWQKEAVLHSSAESFKDWLGDIIFDCPESKRDEFLAIMHENIMFPHEVSQWAKRLFSDNIDYSQEQNKIIADAGKDFFVTIKNYLEQHQDSFEYKSLVQAIKDQTGLKGKKLFLPLRVAFTLFEHGPEMERLFCLIGSDKLLARVDNIIDNYTRKPIN